VFHQNDNVDSIEDFNFALEHQSGMGLCKSDQRLKHTNSLAVFSQGFAAAKVGEVGLEKQLSLLGTNWLDEPLDVHDILE